MSSVVTKKLDHDKQNPFPFLSKQNFNQNMSSKSGKWQERKCCRAFFLFPCLMTFLVLFAFHRNQQFLNENVSNMYSDKFTAPEELKFTNEFIVIAVIVKGKKSPSIAQSQSIFRRITTLSRGEICVANFIPSANGASPSDKQLF
jgi:hypothetical protein